MKRGNHLLSTLVAGFFLAAVLLAEVSYADGEFSVTSVTTRLRQNTYLADIHINYALSQTALEALDNGVRIILDVHIQIRRSGAWIWEQRIFDRHLLYSIKYQALSEVYQVVNLARGTKTNFVTRDAAIAALGEIRGLPLVTQEVLEDDEEYVVRVKTSLDIESLPLPLRPLAYLKPSWNLTSEWSRWPLKP